MKYFWAQLVFFASVWAWMIYAQGSQPTISMLFGAIAFALFFMMFSPTVHGFVWWVFTSVLFIHGLLTDQWIATTILLLYGSVLASYRLRGPILYSYIGVQQLLIFAMYFIKEAEDWVFLVSSMLVSAMIAYTYAHIAAKRSMQDMYEQLTIEYRQLRRWQMQAEEEVRTQERTHIARNIHDSVGHRLTALMMHLEMLAIQRKDNTFRELNQMAAESLQETRDAVHALQQEEIEGIATVIHMIQKIEAESRMFVEFTTKQGVLSLRLSPEKNVILYRVIQEALTNAMRHARTKNVHITLGKTAIDDVLFEIENDITPSSPIQEGFGLSQMRKRIEEIDGTIAIHSLDGKFNIRGVIPIDHGGVNHVERDDC